MLLWRKPPGAKARRRRGRLAGGRIRSGLSHFIGVVLATMQAGSIFLVKAYFESSAEQAARIVLTNQTGGLTAAQFQAEICNQLTALFNCGQVVVELEPVPAGTTNLMTQLPTFDSRGNLVGTPTVDVGANAASSGTDMVLVVMYPWPVYGGPLGLNFSNLGNGKMLMTSTQVFRTEPQSIGSSG
jgi:Flp pilus assembly protein TadG